MTVSSPPKRGAQGRPVSTSHAAIEQAAFRLFAEHGFDATTLEDIAREVGVGRRTLFRYFESKNDIPWGQFERTLDGFRVILDAMPEDIPLWEAVHRGVMQFNDFPPDASPPHEQRMRLILETPTLQAHSVLRYAEWRQVIADYVAKRLDCSPTDLLPQTVGHVSLALALAAYADWLDDPSRPLLSLLDQSMLELRVYLGAQYEGHLQGGASR
jgi:mycofactocin system transcriptional regulator